MDLTLILLLIALNAVFALSEMAVVASRSARLQHLEEDGRPGAAAAAALHRDPARFLSTVQVGITAVGVLAGALGERAIAEPLAARLAEWPALTPHAAGVAFAVTVVLITFLSVVLGELVPKRLALLAPERVALLVAAPMRVFARLAAPVVWLLSKSSGAVLALVPRREGHEPPVSDEEIAVLMEQGAAAGVFHRSEQAYVSNVLRLDERRVTSIMTPRQQFHAVDLDDDPATVRAQVGAARHTRIVVCRGGPDNVLGIVEVAELLADMLAGLPLDVAARVRDPLRVPETATTTSLIETFRAAGRQIALVTDEYGEVQGLVTDSDFLGAIVGDIGTSGTPVHLRHPAARGRLVADRGRAADRGPAGRARAGAAAGAGGASVHDRRGLRAPSAGTHSARSRSLRVGGPQVRGRRHGRPAGGQGAGHRGKWSG